ncbi:hypothetical protein BC936DRAFT_147449 [Jimgerdemannia flammicorona]|uniref:Uncharacterized protein n=1 Tax=Jimgerdemannia flammicorona TaxID=994334 RepID=A0A433D5B3_9FUNG|nr:hypothetical protein BC936DRAFT_147449 [Jimgerdemannia flammicorona]
MTRDDSDGTKGKVDVEAPAPVDVVGEDAAEEWPDDGGEGEDAAEEALGDDVGDDDHHTRHQAGAANTCDGAGDDQHRHVGCNAAEEGTDEENGDGEEHGGLVGMNGFSKWEYGSDFECETNVIKLGLFSPYARKCLRTCHTKPGTTWTRDGRQRDGYNGLIERAHEQGETQADEHGEQLLERQILVPGLATIAGSGDGLCNLDIILLGVVGVELEDGLPERCWGIFDLNFVL